MFKVNNRKSCEICLKLPIKEPKRHQWRRSATVNFEHISHLFWCLYYWLYKCQLCWLIYMLGLFFLNRLTQKRVWDVVKHLWWSFLTKIFHEIPSLNIFTKQAPSQIFDWFLKTPTAWKVSKYGVISGPHFPVCGLNTEIYGVVFSPRTLIYFTEFTQMNVISGNHVVIIW